jgi:DNA-binding response OmpR family regulator
MVDMRGDYSAVVEAWQGGGTCGKLDCVLMKKTWVNGVCVEDRVEKNEKKIVHIEDEPDMIDLVKLILERKGYQVIGAAGGQEGLDAVREYVPDLVLLDLMMPDIEGWDVYQQMRAHDETKNIPVIIVTAKAQNIDKVLGLHIAKVDDYISKPFSPQELVDAIERVLERDE